MADVLSVCTVLTVLHELKDPSELLKSADQQQLRHSPEMLISNWFSHCQVFTSPSRPLKEVICGTWTTYNFPEAFTMWHYQLCLTSVSPKFANCRKQDLTTEMNSYFVQIHATQKCFFFPIVLEDNIQESHHPAENTVAFSATIARGLMGGVTLEKFRVYL